MLTAQISKQDKEENGDITAEEEMQIIEEHRRYIESRTDLSPAEKSKRFADDMPVFLYGISMYYDNQEV